MSKKWKLESLLYSFEFIESEEFRKLIEETAEILYNDFCQLPIDSSFCVSINETETLKQAA
ncbi:MAG: hypothetical protein Q7U04_12045 [Bacteriovorax sp.]|nr:hypothetical protein [Bacteriovorax sp.]